MPTAKPKNGKRWEHKELEARLKDPGVLRVTEQNGLYGVVRRSKDGTPSVMFRWRFRFNKKLADFTAGTWPGDGLEEIRERHTEAIGLHKAGKNPTAERTLQRLVAQNTQSEQLCWRRLNSDPPCRSNIDPGRVAEFGISNCG
jgi:Arm DNA-binding domain